MSCLSKKHRLNKSKEFSKIYKTSNKWHTSSFISFYNPSETLKAAFVTSKKVGNAVLRTKARRRVRAVFLNHEKKIKIGTYIFVIKNNIHIQSFNDLKKDFNFAFKRLKLFK